MLNKFLLKTKQHYQQVETPSTYPTFLSHDLFRNGFPALLSGASTLSLNKLDLPTLPTIAFYSFPNRYFSPAFISFVASFSSKEHLLSMGVISIRLVAGTSMRGTLLNGSTPCSPFEGQGYFLIQFSSWGSAISFFKQTFKGLFKFTDLLEENQKEAYQHLDQIFKEPEFCTVNSTLLDINFLRRYYSYTLHNPVLEQCQSSFPRMFKAVFSLSPHRISSQMLLKPLTPSFLLFNLLWGLLRYATVVGKV